MVQRGNPHTRARGNLNPGRHSHAPAWERHALQRIAAIEVSMSPLINGLFVRSLRHTKKYILGGKRRFRDHTYACGKFFYMPRSLRLSDLERKYSLINRLIYYT